MEGGQRVQGRTRQDDEAVEHCRVAIAEWRLASVDCSGDCRLAIVGWRLSVGDCRLAIDSEDCRVATADRIEKGLQERVASVGRVILDYDLKREYQQFLQEPNRGRADGDGGPHREPEEIAAWAREHDLPCFDVRAVAPLPSGD